GGRAAEPLPQLAQAAQKLLLGREASRDEPRGALGAVPAAKALDHSLRMDRRLRIVGELAHRRRTAEAVGAGLGLAADVRVGVALADPRLELCKCLRVDPRDRSIRATTRHANQNRASHAKCNRSRCSLTAVGVHTLARCVSSSKWRWPAVSGASRGSRG